MTESQSRNRVIGSENKVVANYAYDPLKRALNLVAPLAHGPRQLASHHPTACTRRANAAQSSRTGQLGHTALPRSSAGSRAACGASLAAAAVAPLRQAMKHSAHCSHQGPSPTAGRVEPLDAPTEPAELADDESSAFPDDVKCSLEPRTVSDVVRPSSRNLSAALCADCRRCRPPSGASSSLPISAASSDLSAYQRSD